MTNADLDALILSHCRGQPRKVAMIVGVTLMDIPVPRPPGVDDLFVAERVGALVNDGRLLGFGDLGNIRVSEVALPPPEGWTDEVSS